MDMDFGEQILNEVQKQVRNLKQLNLLVMGKTGVGKSTLINSVFRENLAATGVGHPITSSIEEIAKKDFPLHIFDTRGFEIGKGNFQEIQQEIQKKIKEMNRSSNVSEKMHCIWYCISTPSHRVEDAEIEYIKQLADENRIENVPVIVVLTQSYSKNEAKAMKDYLQLQGISVAKIVPVLAQDYEIDDEYVVKATGLDTLVEVMGQVLPDDLRKTLQNVQKTSLNEKRKAAFASVAAAATAAAAEAAIPVPLADSAMLVPTQVSMLAGISVIFGFDINRTIINSLLSSTLGATGATYVGKTIFANLMKMIPGVGSVTGGVVSAATASAITTALGTAYTELMTAVYKNEITREELGSDMGAKKFKEYFKEYQKKKA